MPKKADIKIKKISPVEMIKNIKEEIKQIVKDENLPDEGKGLVARRIRRVNAFTILR